MKNKIGPVIYKIYSTNVIIWGIILKLTQEAENCEDIGRTQFVTLNIGRFL